jgi:hypothetical protein
MSANVLGQNCPFTKAHTMRWTADTGATAINCAVLSHNTVDLSKLAPALFVMFAAELHLLIDLRSVAESPYTEAP